MMIYTFSAATVSRKRKLSDSEDEGTASVSKTRKVIETDDEDAGSSEVRVPEESGENTLSKEVLSDSDDGIDPSQDNRGQVYIISLKVFVLS